MKRLIWAVVGICLLIVIAWAGVFYWRHLRGAGPALTGPPQNIAKLLEKAGEVKTAASSAKNASGYPLKLPPGFSISIFAENLGSPRVLALDSEGTLLASIPSQGRIVALPDKDRDGKADRVATVVSGLHRPHGFAFYPQNPKKLYIAEPRQLAIYDYDSKTLKASNKRKILDLPPGGRHWTRNLLFLPGATPGGTGVSPVQPYRLLISVGLGDDLPPDEIDIVQEGKHYGWPWCYGKQVHDEQFDPAGRKKDFCKDTVPSYINLPAHSAPLGLAFVPAAPAWPQDYHYNLLVAYHGSWNRTIPTGYKVVRCKPNAQGKYLGEEDFITGWLTKEGALGRPVDILIKPNGVMYISDDKA